MDLHVIIAIVILICPKTPHGAMVYIPVAPFYWDSYWLFASSHHVILYCTFGPDGPNTGESPWPDKTTSGAMNSGQLYRKKIKMNENSKFKNDQHTYTNDLLS